MHENQIDFIGHSVPLIFHKKTSQFSRFFWEPFGVSTNEKFNLLLFRGKISGRIV